MAGAALPWAALAGYAALRYLWSFRGKPLLPRLRAWGPYIAHLGIILVALGYGISYGLDQVETVELEEGGSTGAAGFTITLDDVVMRPGEENRLEAQFRLHRGERLVVEDSIWTDPAGRLVATRQVVIEGQAQAGGAHVSWVMKRAR